MRAKADGIMHFLVLDHHFTSMKWVIWLLCGYNRFHHCSLRPVGAVTSQSHLAQHEQCSVWNELSQLLFCFVFFPSDGVVSDTDLYKYICLTIDKQTDYVLLIMLIIFVKKLQAWIESSYCILLIIELKSLPLNSVVGSNLACCLVFCIFSLLFAIVNPT